MIPIKLIPAALLLSCVLPAMGEDSIPEGSDESNPIQLRRATQQDKAILKSARAEEPGRDKAPSFVIKTANSNFVMTIGGEVNPILGWDIGNNLYKQDDAGISFVPEEI